MTRRHSLVTRALALVMALVLIASNGAGLTLGAKAAENGNLFDLMSAHGASNAKLDAVLAYADYMAELKAMNISVEYEEAPAAAKGTLRQGTLKVEEIGAWVPYTWGTAATPFNGVYSVAVGEDTAAVNVTYKQELGVAEEISGVYTWVSDLAAIPAAQATVLGTLSTGNKLTALKVLEGEFIYGLSADVDAIKASDLGIKLTAEDLGLTTEEILKELGKEIPEGVEIPENVQAEIDAKIQEKIDEEIAKELESVKAEFKAIINKMMNRLVTEEDPYAVYPDYKGKPGVYVDYLRIYAMMDQYSKQGLPFYYDNAAEIIAEMEALATVLGEMLGEENEDGINYNQKAMEYLMVKGEYGVEVSQIASLKDQMVEGAATLRAQEENRAVVAGKIDMAACSDLQGLLDALAACGGITGAGKDIVLTSAKLEIKDDSWKFIETSVNGTPVSCKFATDAVLTEADIETAVAQIKAVEPHFDVDVSAVEALVGTKMTQNVSVECPAVAKVYTVAIKDAEAVKVSGDATVIVLPFAKNHEITYTVNGETVVVTDEETATIAITEADLNKIAAGEYVVTMVEDNDLSAVNWDNLVRKVNEGIGREALVLDGDTLIANITLKELGAFGKAVFDMNVNTILLNGEEFLVNLDNSYIIRIQTLIDALLCDATFTSQKLINLGYTGSGNLLNSTIEIFESEKNFVLNLPTVPAQMGKVAKGLDAVKDYFWFKSSGPIQNRMKDAEVNPFLHVSLNLPEKVYEAYLTAAIVSGRIDNDDAAALNNKVAMEFMADYIELLMNSDANTTTFENTLAILGAEKDLEGYEDYYQMLKKVATSDNFNYTINEDTVDFNIAGAGSNVKALLEVLGLDYTELTMGQDVIEDEEALDATAVVTLVNEVPQFEALVIDPARLNDAGKKAKIMAANYVTDLTKASIQGPAAIMLLGNVDGDLVFDHTTILDLNGFTVNGNVTANGRLFIVDSSLNTVSGAGVTGAVSGNVNVLAGNYPTANVEGFLRDGYYMDGKNVKNAMYEVVNGQIVVDGNLYIENVDGYLPAAHYMAADIAIDMALNYYFAAGFEANGNGIYSIKFEDLVKILETKDLGNVADQTLACFNAAGTSAFINEVIADLLDFGAIANAIENDSSLGAYTFTVYPWSVAVRHETAGDYVTMDVLPGSNGKSYTLGLTVAIPEGNIKSDLVKALKVLDKRVVESKVEVTIDQPVREGKNLVVGGSGTASFTLDFSDDQKYNEMLAGVIAYFNEEVKSILVDEKMCIINLNNAMSKVTVGQFFTAVDGVIQNKELNFAAIAEKLGVTLTEGELAKLEELYADFKTVCTKVLNKFDLKTNSTAPLSELADGNGAFVVNGDVQDHSADAYLKGFGLIANLGYSDVTLTVQLAPKCTEILGDANWDGAVNILDVIVLNRYVVNLITADSIHMCVCDLNGDGNVNVLDLILLNRYVVHEIEKFPVEK